MTTAVMEKGKTMNDYIKREDAERLLRYYFLSALTEDERVDELNRIPSADVIKVVRCRRTGNKETGRLLQLRGTKRRQRI